MAGRLAGMTQDEVFAAFDALNADPSHHASRDDICTGMACVRTMLDYVPDAFWEGERDILDPCCGNGNFGAYAMIKSPRSRIYMNELSPVRHATCRELLDPEHLRCGDFFDIAGDWGMRWDLVMANPPYSGGANKNRGLYVRFLDRSIDLLRDGGYLCYVVPNSWMTYNTDNAILRRLLTEGSFLVIDNDAKRHFPGVGSSFVIIVWQKGVMANRTKVVNAYMRRDVQEGVELTADLPLIPLYVSPGTLSLVRALIDTGGESRWRYRCDLHNHTRRALLRDERSDVFPYETIHTPRKTRWASVRQDDIWDRWLVITPLSTYFVPYVRHNVNVTQSVGYVACDTEEEARETLARITRDPIKLLVHLTRYGNFNNIQVLRHLRFDDDVELPQDAQAEVDRLAGLIGY